ncbi:MAG: ferritin-like domain-containing protein [Gammaproteobacteria bacterium]|nr:ferritin-like domain-containing protein [Gammaproteobacteria bacterium]MBU2477991.1 ferritin-like domain-containing protein [Gammaproteobacteria bacterium]
MATDFYTAALNCLAEPDPARKCALTQSVWSDLQTGQLKIRPEKHCTSLDAPGRPELPRLVAPRELPRRRLHSDAGRAALLHALAHIEFNAINLAWDAVCRFADMPEAYYRDWALVAAEEAYHFGLLRDRLQALGFAYGDLPAHNGLWEMALQTRHDVLLRMALVPRVLEARGLDVTPGMMERLREAGDPESVAILEIILRDEIGHVAIGSRWFDYSCAQRHLTPATTFRALLKEHLPGRVKGPFHRAAREQAGFSAEELDDLETLDRGVE